MSWLDKWRARARTLKRDTYALYLAARDPRTPWYARALAALILAYAFSPIDLIPDFVPLLGYLDDLVFVPLGLALLARLLPDEVMADARQRASHALSADRPRSCAAATIIVLIWVGMAVLGTIWLWRAVSGYGLDQRAGANVRPRHP